MGVKRFSLLATILWVALFVACSDPAPAPAPEPAPTPATSTESEPEPEAPADEIAEAAAPTNPPTNAPAAGALRTHLDLASTLHLADVETSGLLIDMGTPARMKYTNGTWNSGWGDDGHDGDETFTSFARMGRVYFNVEERRALSMKVRLRGSGRPLISYLNGETLPERAIEAGAFRDVTIPIAREHVRAGENYLLFRVTRGGTFDVASIEIGDAATEGEDAEEAAAPDVVQPPIRTRATVAGVSRPVVEAAPGTTISHYVDVPEDGRLTFGVAGQGGVANLRVTLSPVRGESRELFSGPAGEAFVDQSIALPAGIARLSFTVTGEGKAFIAEPRLAVADQPEPPPAEARNVVVLTIDTLRASKLRPYNPRTRVRTPALDTFAEEGAVFENAQSPENWTKPSVASILTSLHPTTHGTQGDASRLPGRFTTLGEVYKGAGFDTATFLANGYVSTTFGFNQGWDHYTNYIREQRRTVAENVFGEASEWIEEHKDERFFVYIQTIDPHVPYDPPDEYLRMYDARSNYRGQVRNRNTHLLLEEAKKRDSQLEFTESDITRIKALHDGSISYHDHHFGVFLEKLKELGLDENTIIVVTSDHGEEFNDHGSWGHGHSVYQELLAVPLIVRWPGVLDGGLRPSATVSTMDIGPTILEATGVGVPDEFEGRSLLGHLRGNAPTGPYVAFSNFQDNRRVITGGDFKLIIRPSLTYVMFHSISSLG